jgi:hypothetical protein
VALLLSVSKDWAAAVHSMRPLDAKIKDVLDDLFLLSLCNSPLARHVGSLCVPFSFSPSTLDAVSSSRHLSNLRSLDCILEGSWIPSVPQPFPPRLRDLRLFLESVGDEDEGYGYVEDASFHLDDAVLRAVAALPQLQDFSLSAMQARSCSLAPLLSAPSLHTLKLELDKSVLESGSNIATLRTLPHLRSLDCNLSAAGFMRLVQLPHTIQLDTLHARTALTEERAAVALVQLSQLTDLSFKLGTPHTDFLRLLPNLRRLELDFKQRLVTPNADRIMHSLHALTALSSLIIVGNSRHDAVHRMRLTSDHLAACLPHMPLLHTLCLWDAAAALDSLRFLSSGPITRSLQKLVLVDFSPRLPLSELSHVHALSSLRELTLLSVFDRPLDEETQRLYKPPSTLLPSLSCFSHKWRPAQ